MRNQGVETTADAFGKKFPLLFYAVICYCFLVLYCRAMRVGVCTSTVPPMSDNTVASRLSYMW